MSAQNNPSEKIWVHTFSDKDGGITRHPFSPTWPLEFLTETHFVERSGKTIVTLKWSPVNATDEEVKTFNHAHQGMAHGWGGIFDQLDEHLAKN